MLAVLAAITILAYCAASALFVSDLVGTDERSSTLSYAAMFAGAVFCVAWVSLAGARDGFFSVFGVEQVFALIAAAMSVGFLAMRGRFRVRAAGVIVAPICALLVLGSLALRGGPNHPTALLESSPLLATHIGFASLGLGAFVIAACLAILFLVQERNMRRRNFGRAFRRMPSLQELDAASFALVSLGFALYTVAVGLGVVVSLNLEHESLTPRSALAYVAWVAFAAVVYARIRSGWRGRRSAIMTVVGCVTAGLVLVLYGVG